MSLIKVTKKYKEFSMEDLNVTIPKGIATVLIGNNGAGKTTLLKIMSGILVHEGDVLYEDKHINTDDETFKEQMVFIPDTCCFFNFFTIKKVYEFMKLGFHHFDEQRFLHLCERFEIIKDEKISSKKIKDMSTGNQMKLMICAMLARGGKYLLLDEPAANLDPIMQELLQENMR